MPFETVVKELTAAGVDATKVEELIKDEKIATALQRSIENGLRQSDYDRKMNLGKAELAAEKQRLAEQAAELETTKTRMTAEFLEAHRQREEAEALNSEVLARAKTASAVYGTDLVKELFGDHTPGAPPARTAPAAAPPPAGPDVNKRIDGVEELFRALPNLMVDMQSIAIEHATLFPDKPFNPREIMDKAVELRQPVTQVWDNLYGATAKKQEIQAEKFRQEGAVAERARLEQEQSKRAATPFGMKTPASPIFAAAAKSAAARGTTETNGRDQRRAEAVQRATAAMAEGKYAPGYARREA